MTEMADSASDRILRKSGAERVSEDAPRALSKELEKYGKFIGGIANYLAQQAGRKTVKSDDVEKALNLVLLLKQDSGYVKFLEEYSK